MSSTQLLAVGTKVRFKAEYLARLQEKESKRLVGRTGTVIGYRMGATEPIVEFPASGRFKELRLFEVDPARLEEVESAKSA